MIQRNIGFVDMVVRLLVAAGLVYLGFFGNPIVSNGLPKDMIGYFTLIPLITGLTKFCPLYALAGIRTN